MKFLPSSNVSVRSLKHKQNIYRMVRFDVSVREE